MTLCEFTGLLDRETCAEMELCDEGDGPCLTPKLCIGYDARYAMRRVAQVFPVANPHNLVHPRLCVILEKEDR